MRVFPRSSLTVNTRYSPGLLPIAMLSHCYCLFLSCEVAQFRDLRLSGRFAVALLSREVASVRVDTQRFDAKVPIFRLSIWSLRRVVFPPVKSQIQN